MPSHTDPLVSTDWLAERLESDDIVVLDASWHMPAAARDPAAEFLAAHIPGARFFDIDGVADHTTDLPHMLPSPDAFAAAIGALGVGNDTTVVAYDCNGLIASARLWWTLRVMGHDKVVVVDGGLTKWRAEGRAVESGDASGPTRSFTPNFRPELVRDFEAVKASLGAPTLCLLDARPAGRFTGEVQEPRAGLRGGHMPSSLVPALRRISPSSPPAALASPPPPWPWPWRGWGGGMWRCMTAPGPNGAAGPMRL
jgi:thiosulfate/3-mercaptopyruvate sulfurtransferase